MLQRVRQATLLTASLADSARALTHESLRLLSAGLGGGGSQGGLQVDDPMRIKDAWLELSTRLWADPAHLLEVQSSFWRDYLGLCQGAVRRAAGLGAEPVIRPEAGDRRFRDQSWDEHPLFDCIKQSYLLAARACLDLVNGVDGMDERTRTKLEFATRQVTDALAPTNFAATNPQVLRETLESGGRNLVDGLNNFIADLGRGNGRLNISMTDLDAFEVGVDLAVTPGKVVYQNELMQLIQYAPTTEKVHRRPLLVIPPWMNKYYIMDLRPGSSMVQWLVDQGHTVFMISWVNPDAGYRDTRFDDYMRLGPLAALDAVEQATGAREVNAVGYCLGGILLAATLGWMAARDDTRIRSASLLTTMVDFRDPGDIALFIDPAGLDELEAKIWEQGCLDGRSMFDTTRVLRANDLVWSFFVNSYLLGRSPKPFDLLYWNADATNMPAATHTFFMRSMYLENRLREPGGVTLNDVPIDVTRVQVPTYVLSTHDDHIAPWRTTYQTTQLFSGPIKFVLGASGHIAGVVNPPQHGKYGYWTNAELPPEADDWLAGARQHRGSWWPDWMRWLRGHGGGKVAGRVPGDGALGSIEDAPGSYVRKRLE